MPTDMMADSGYWQSQLERYKKRLQDQLTGRPAEIAGQEQSARDLLDQSDVTARSAVTDALTGFSPSIGAAGQEQLEAQQPALNRERETTLSYQRMKNMSDHFNQLYAHALDAYQSAGYNLQQSQTFARAWAQQQANQDYQAEVLQSRRDYATQKDLISQSYQDMASGINVDYGDPVQQAMIRSIVGIAPLAGYLGYQKYAGRTPMSRFFHDQTTFSTPIDPATGRRLTGMEKFDPATQSYGYLNR